MKLIDDDGRIIGEFSFPKIEPGTTTVLTLSERPSVNLLEQIRAIWDKHFPNRKLLVLEKGITLSVQEVGQE